MRNKAVQNKTYKNLVVYVKAKSLTIDAYKLFSNKRLSKTHESLIIQVLRSISSVGANIVEGYGRHYQKSFRQFLANARGSSFESEYWLEIILELNIFEKNKVQDFINRNEEIYKMITSLMKKIESDLQP